MEVVFAFSTATSQPGCVVCSKHDSSLATLHENASFTGSLTVQSARILGCGGLDAGEWVLNKFTLIPHVFAQQTSFGISITFTVGRERSVDEKSSYSGITHHACVSVRLAACDSARRCIRSASAASAHRHLCVQLRQQNQNSHGDDISNTVARSLAHSTRPPPPQQSRGH